MRQSGALPSQIIEDLIAQERIYSLQPIPSANIQPASLDLRLGNRGWRVGATFLPRQGEPISELLLNHALESLDFSQPVVLQQGGTYVVEVEERFFSDEIRELENLTNRIAHVIQQAIGLSVKVKLVEPKSIERSMGKTQHVIDKRKLK